MTGHDTTTSQSKLIGLLAEFSSPDELVAAAHSVRQAGYRRTDAFSPFPIHRLDQALAIPSSRLPWMVLTAGIVGGMVALAGQWWTNTVDYPFVVSGKPLFSLPANIPVTFEVIILCSAFAAFFGMLVLNGLPKLANSLFRSDHFRRTTSDGFFLLIESTDERFSQDATSAMLENLGATNVETCHEQVDSAQLPKYLPVVAIIIAALATVPPLLIAKARATKSEQPRLTTFPDMDYQPKFKAQTKSSLFADGRSARPPVAGTITRGELQDDDRFYRGLEPYDSDGPSQRRSMLQVSVQDLDSDGSSQTTADEPNWTSTFPLPASDELMRRGRDRFNIYCATCHGRAGYGNGLVSQRALSLEQGTWVPPTSIHAEYVREQPVGQLFNTITNGVRKMPGYGQQITPEDRWAIVLYIRALQRSRNASPDDVPEEELAKLRDLN